MTEIGAHRVAPFPAFGAAGGACASDPQRPPPNSPPVGRVPAGGAFWRERTATKVFTRQERADFAQHWADETVSYAEMARHFGISEKTVKNHAARWNLGPKARGKMRFFRRLADGREESPSVSVSGPPAYPTRIEWLGPVEVPLPEIMAWAERWAPGARSVAEINVMRAAWDVPVFAVPIGVERV